MQKYKKSVVIIGGGTAGIIVANRIQKHFDVTIVEKSKYKKYPLIYKIPLLIGLLFRSKKLKYMSKIDFKLSSGRHVPFLASNLWGGASVMNGCVHMLGNKLHWSSILKQFNSNYDELLESYNDIFSLSPISKNKINLSISPQNIIDRGFIDTINKLGIPNGDMNLSDQESCGPILNTVRKYFRTSVLSLVSKKSFKSYTNEKVNDVLFDHSGKVCGVITDRRTINSDYVILCGGVIGSFSLLSKLKSKHNILRNIVIGEGIQDHTNLRVNVITNQAIGSLNEVDNSLYKKISLLTRHFLGIPTLMRGTGATSAAHLDLDRDGVVDTRIQIVQFSETGRHGHGNNGKLFSDSKPGFSISITPINPKSKGKIGMIDSTTNVDPGFLSSTEDMDILKLALEYCLKLLKTSPMSKYVLKIENEDVIANNPEKYITANIFSGQHLIGGSYNILDANFEVDNVNGLYICDASVFNEYAASNIHSSLVLIADLFAKKMVARNYLDHI